VGLAAALAWAVAAAITAGWPTEDEIPYNNEFAWGLAVVAGLLVLTGLAGGRLQGTGFQRLRHFGPWLLVLGLILTLWEVTTAKLGLLPRPFFAPPQAFLEVYLDDWPRLLDCVVHSLGLLAVGYTLGATLGFITGVSLGWSRQFSYWGQPLLRLIGPLPATAYLPIAFFAFPSSWSASVFVIAVASGFPVTILTWSGISSVSSAYYDVARTVGASNRFLVLRVAIPAAMPHVFVGLFMGLASSFAVLFVAEMLGVKAGLGWYLQWAQGWGAYANMYAALLVMALMCSGLITLIFRARDSLLAWQKGLVRW